MARIIAREDYALKVGAGSCSSYTANRGVTKARAVSYGASISGTYSDNLLVAKEDLYKTYCSCNSACRGYAACPSYSNCTCVGDCTNCGYTACSCNNDCSNCGYKAATCSCVGDGCGYTACSCVSACANCSGYCGTTCNSQRWCTHCFSEKYCSCDGNCSSYRFGVSGGGWCSSDGTKGNCQITFGPCTSICLCTGVCGHCASVGYDTCYTYSWCNGHCHYYGETSYGCSPNCSECGSNACSHCSKSGCTCNDDCAYCGYTAATCSCNGDGCSYKAATCSCNNDVCGYTACSCYSQNCSNCTCNGEAQYATCSCYYYN